MDRKTLLKHLVILMFFMFIANNLALKFYWYSLIWYFDMVMHTLGGFWVGMFFFYFFSMFKYMPKGFRLFFRVIVAALAIGLLWEFYEYIVLNVIGVTPWDFSDTLSDLLFDLLGAVLSCVYFSKFIILDSRNRLQ